MKIGILGAGQLGTMLALAGYPLGLRFRFFDPDPDAPGHRLAEHIIGAYDDAVSLRQFASGLDAVTYELENIPLTLARALADSVPVYPSPRALDASQELELNGDVLVYLNRLSDLLFILARSANAAARVGEPLWKPGA